MKYRIIPTPEYDEAVKLGRFPRAPTCFGVRGNPGMLHSLAKANGLTRSLYNVVPVPEPLVMSDPDPRLN
eukprot:g19223.t1